jgi:hypothetical protein
MGVVGGGDLSSAQASDQTFNKSYVEHLTDHVLMLRDQSVEWTVSEPYLIQRIEVRIIAMIAEDREKDF